MKLEGNGFGGGQWVVDSPGIGQIMKLIFWWMPTKNLSAAKLMFQFVRDILADERLF